MYLSAHLSSLCIRRDAFQFSPVRNFVRLWTNECERMWTLYRPPAATPQRDPFRPRAALFAKESTLSRHFHRTARENINFISPPSAILYAISVRDSTFRTGSSAHTHWLRCPIERQICCEYTLLISKELSTFRDPVVGYHVVYIKIGVNDGILAEL